MSKGQRHPASLRKRALIDAELLQHWPGARFTYGDIFQSINTLRERDRVPMSAVHGRVRELERQGLLQRVAETFHPVVWQWHPDTYAAVPSLENRSR